jgi:magnesium chelatase subunit D
MTEESPSEGPSAWQDAVLAAVLCAVAPADLGGVHLKALPGPVRDVWLETLRALLTDDAPLRRIPLHVSEASLLGGLDLAATLRAGRPMAQRGLLVQSSGGLVLLAMAERVSRVTVAHLSAVMDFSEVVLERDGLAARDPAELGVVALDESTTQDESLTPVLQDRLAFALDLRPLGIHDIEDNDFSAAEIRAARARLPSVRHAPDDVERLCAAALSLGVASLRISLLAARVARVAAALDGRDVVAAQDLAAAARLVLAPRATMLPVPETAPEAPEEPGDDADQPQPPPGDAADQTDDSTQPTDQPLEDRVLEAAVAAIPARLLASLQAGKMPRGRAQAPGKSGAVQRSKLRGRPMGVLRGDPRSGSRLSLIDTLRAAAPWQRVRQRQLAAAQSTPPRVLVQRDDFRVVRFKQRAETTTIFVVDASGSAALHRLAEAKGAVELLLADCYVRRDQVALIAFRGQAAEMLLPPTRSLVRAKRCLAALPGGGGTPLAAGIDAAAALSDLVIRRGGTPTVVCLTDGRANVGRQGSQGREQALADALDSAAALRFAGVRSMVVDMSPRPHANAERLAEAMRGVYLPLPHADAARLSAAVQSVGRGAGPASRAS